MPTHPSHSTKLPPRRHPTRRRLLLPAPLHLNIQPIQPLQRQVQKLMLVLPPHILLPEPLRLLRRRGWLRDLGDEVGGGGLGDAVEEDAEEGHFEEEEEGEGEAVEDAFAVVEPEALLLWAVVDAREVRFELELEKLCQSRSTVPELPSGSGKKDEVSRLTSSRIKLLLEK